MRSIDQIDLFSEDLIILGAQYGSGRVCTDRYEAHKEATERGIKVCILYNLLPGYTMYVTPEHYHSFSSAPIIRARTFIIWAKDLPEKGRSYFVIDVLVDHSNRNYQLILLRWPKSFCEEIYRNDRHLHRFKRMPFLLFLASYIEGEGKEGGSKAILDVFRNRDLIRMIATFLPILF